MIINKHSLLLSGNKVKILWEDLCTDTDRIKALMTGAPYMPTLKTIVRENFKPLKGVIKGNYFYFPLQSMETINDFTVRILTHVRTYVPENERLG